MMPWQPQPFKYRGRLVQPVRPWLENLPAFDWWLSRMHQRHFAKSPKSREKLQDLELHGGSHVDDDRRIHARAQIVDFFVDLLHVTIRRQLHGNPLLQFTRSEKHFGRVIEFLSQFLYRP